MELKKLALSLGLICSAFVSSASADSASTPVLWNARFGSLKGNLDCKYGDSNCNRCVNDVKKQFSFMTSKRENFIALVNGWTWKPGDKPKPAGLNPDDVLTVLPGNENINLPLGLDFSVGPKDGSHFQSFVRSQSAVPNLFASYGGDHSAVFMVEGLERQPTGEIGGGSLTNVYKGATSHPGGMAAVGDYVLVASDSTDDDPHPIMQFLNASKAPQAPVQMEWPTRMANVAAAQLASGGYVLITMATSKVNNYRFWYTPSLDDPQIEPMYANEITGDRPKDLPKVDGYTGFENITLITECGTGNLFMLAVNGDPDFSRDNLGVWALYSIQSDFTVHFEDNNKVRMHGPACNTRASGSAFAGRDGELVLYCHQKGERATQLIDAMSCIEESAIGIPAAVVPIQTVVDEADGLAQQFRWGRLWKKIKKAFKKAAVVVAATAVPGVAETAIATAAAAVGTATATATAFAGTAAATGTAVIGTGVAVGSTVATNFGINTVVAPNGSCNRAISADTRIYYTEMWPADDDDN